MYLCGDALISFQCFVLQSSALSVIQQDWFKVASGQQASFKEVDGYMACFEDFSTELLEHVVNMTDGNVCITTQLNSVIWCNFKEKIISLVFTFKVESNLPS